MDKLTLMLLRKWCRVVSTFAQSRFSMSIDPFLLDIRAIIFKSTSLNIQTNFGFYHFMYRMTKNTALKDEKQKWIFQFHKENSKHFYSLNKYIKSFFQSYDLFSVLRITRETRKIAPLVHSLLHKYKDLRLMYNTSNLSNGKQRK